MKNTVFLICISLSILMNAQKPESSNYSINYKNIPQFDLGSKTYQVEYNVDAHSKTVLDENKLSIELKGYQKGNDITLSFTSTMPEINQKITPITYNSGTTSEYKRYVGLTYIRATSKLEIKNTQNKIIKTIQLSPDPQKVDLESEETTSQSSAQLELNKIGYEKRKEMIKNYLSELITIYQEELDQLYGKFTRQADLGIFTIKSKKYNYSQFNKMTLAFQKACATTNILSEENQTIINNAINEWKEAADKYKEGKDSRICDYNIDAIYYNLAIGYLVQGNGDELSRYWQKCTVRKGNKAVEEDALKYIEPMVNNHNSY